MRNKFSSRLDVEYLECISELKYRREDVRCVDKTFGAEGRQVDKGFECSRPKDFPPTGEKRDRVSVAPLALALLIIGAKVVLRELLGPAKRARKTVRALTEARVLH